KVALVTTSTLLSGTCPSSSGIVDLVGYGSSASCFEGTGPSPAPANTSAVGRRANGCSDTQNNRDDFAVSTPQPRNSSAPLNRCLSAGLRHREARETQKTRTREPTCRVGTASRARAQFADAYLQLQHNVRTVILFCDFVIFGLFCAEGRNYRTTPDKGLEALAYKRFGIRPAWYANRPDSIANFIACAIFAGSAAPAIAVFISTASAPSSITIVASLAVPTPAS